jgi:hypothetical protein
MVTGAGKAICRQCIEDFYQAFQEAENEDPGS